MDVSVGLNIWTFFGLCTMEARRAVLHARAAVGEFGGEAIRAEHLLWGLFKPDVGASRHFIGLAVPTAELYERARSLVQGSGAPGSIDVPLDPEALDVLNRAWAEAKALGHAKVRSDHLLLGLLGKEGPAANLLKASGVVDAIVRSAIGDRDPEEDEE
jgi:ATP-dependent Clp protease ATP-binding subunit ClpC